MKRKFKMPNLLKFRRKKLRATAVRRPLRIGAATADYDDLAEPSMKLSRALLIVLLLHVVAVAGIIAFNAIKTRQSTLPASPRDEHGGSGLIRNETADDDGEIQLRR